MMHPCIGSLVPLLFLCVCNRRLRPSSVVFATSVVILINRSLRRSGQRRQESGGTYTTAQEQKTGHALTRAEHFRKPKRSDRN